MIAISFSLKLKGKKSPIRQLADKALQLIQADS